MWLCSSGGRRRYPSPTVQPPPSRLQRGIYPYAVPSSPRFPPRHPTGHTVVESSQNPPNVWYHNPRLRSVQHDLLNHRHVNSPLCPGIRILPDWNPRHPCPLMPCPLKVVDHLYPVILLLQEDSPRVLGVSDRGEGVPTNSVFGVY